MGREIVRVPVGFNHPVNETGEPIPGAHLELLWEMPDETRIGYQIYENVSEGTPVSPIFGSGEELCSWIVDQGISAESAAAFLEQGFAPSLVLPQQGGLQIGSLGCEHRTSTPPQ